ncbi:MAG: histidinol-phosphatase [Dissulfuribacterales bacterium]
MIDYHVHTSLCNHATGTMDQYVKSAINKGLSEICFLDHLTLNKKGSHLSMEPEYVPFYYQSARHLAHVYKDHIRVKVGLEVDFDPKNANRVKEIIAPYAFDVIGGSVHFIENINIVSTKDTQARENEDIDVICSRYLDALHAMVDANGIDIICHIDIFKKFGRRPSAQFDKNFDEILSKIRYNNLTVELNTSGYTHQANESYPNAVLLKKCRDRNIPVTIGSDAHQPQSVGQHYDKAIDLLLTTGYRHVSAFTRRMRYEIPLLKNLETKTGGTL